MFLNAHFEAQAELESEFNAQYDYLAELARSETAGLVSPCELHDHCQPCGGCLSYQGTLDNTIHYACQACGLQTTHEIKPLYLACRHNDGSLCDNCCPF